MYILSCTCVHNFVNINIHLHLLYNKQGGKSEEDNDSSSESEDDEDNDSSSESSEDDDSSSEEEDDGLSEYERLRLQRIARNQARLSTLGFDKPKEEEKKKEKKEKKPRSEPIDRSGVGRKKKQPAEFHYSKHIADNEDQKMPAANDTNGLGDYVDNGEEVSCIINILYSLSSLSYIMLINIFNSTFRMIVATTMMMIRRCLLLAKARNVRTNIRM